MKYLIASTNKCIEVGAIDMSSTLNQGMVDLNQDFQYGNVIGIEKPNNLSEWEEALRKLNVSTGDFFEYFNCPDYLTENLIRFLKKEIEKLKVYL